MRREGSGEVPRVDAASADTRDPTRPKVRSYRTSMTEEEMSRTKGVLFVPHTPGGELARMIERDEDTFSKINRIPQFKLVESTGSRIINTLSRKDPWATKNCD